MTQENKFYLEPMEQNNYDSLTNIVIKSIQSGCAPWQRSLKAKEFALLRPKNYKNKTYYKGSNFINLFYQALENNYPTGLWLSAKDIENLGEKILKNQNPQFVFCYLYKPYLDISGNIMRDFSGQKIYKTYIKKYEIYNIAQTTIKPKITLDEISQNNEIIDKIVQNYGVEISFDLELLDGQCDAMYDAKKHAIYITKKHYFKSVGEYYGVLLHELAHSTASIFGRKKPQNDEEYAFEELIAELASFFICSELKLDFNAKNSVSYIASWSKLLANPQTSIVKASSQAQKIAKYLLSFAKSTKPSKSLKIA